jgi:DNA-binding MarR family transcriptional regulator
MAHQPPDDAQGALVDAHSASVDAPLDALLVQVCRRHHRRAHGLLDALGLYRGQPRLLHVLWDQEGCTHSELAERLHVRPATVTKMLSRMQEAGFVERHKDAEDHRVSRVYLTAAGRDIQERVHQVWQQLEREALLGFSLEERATLYGLLARVRDNYERTDPCAKRSIK